MLYKRNDAGLYRAVCDLMRGKYQFSDGLPVEIRTQHRLIGTTGGVYIRPLTRSAPCPSAARVSHDKISFYICAVSCLYWRALEASQFLLEYPCHHKHGLFTESASDDLNPDREVITVAPARNHRGRQSCAIHP